MGIKTRKLSKINDSLVEWQSVVVADGSTGLTAVAGRGYFINTTAGTITVTLPSATAKPGDTIQLKDYARTWGTNAVSIASNTFDGATNNPSFSTNGQTVTLVYMDNTRGWSLINEDTTTGLGAEFISATGGTITTSGNYKIHTFTGDGTFVVATLGNPTGGPSNVDYLVVAGGGSGGGDRGGGGGGGGFRFYASPDVAPPYPASPLNAPTGLTLSATTYPVTVGGGGAGSPGSVSGNPGSPSVFSTITSAGGGAGGGSATSPMNGVSGGSGGGGRDSPGISGGTGNTPPTSPPQGNNGSGSPSANCQAGGGGGATAVGTESVGGAGAGLPTAFGTSGESGPGSLYYFSGGGGGGGGGPGGSATPNGGVGGIGGGSRGAPTPSVAGGENTGGGSGGQGNNPSATFAGGKGVVIIRYQYQ